MLGMQEEISDIELKQRWRLYWIHCIFEFSHTKLQEMSWIKGTEAGWPNGEIWSSSFEECISSYFDNLNLYEGYAKTVESGNVSKEEADKANTFHRLAAFYDEPSENPEDILKDTEWMEVVEAAKDLWDYLKVSVTSEREIALMKKLDKDFY